MSKKSNGDGLLLPIASLQPCLAVGLNSFIDPFLASKREYRGEALQGELGVQRICNATGSMVKLSPWKNGFFK
jgi:hypothetical protein